jgi:hypothetical protein
VKVFSAKKFFEHSEHTVTGLFIDSKLKKMIINDDGKEVTPLDERNYLNHRLEEVSSIFVVDKKDWKPYSKKGEKE